MTTNTSALHYLLHSAALLEERLRDRLTRIGVKPRQARIIDALSRMVPASQIALARAFDITPASMSTMAVRLIGAGYISREPHPDEARSNVLRLTARGRGLLSEIHAAWREMGTLIADRIGSRDADMLADLTRTLRDSLGGRAPGTVIERPQKENE